MRCGNQNKMDNTKTDDVRKHIRDDMYVISLSNISIETNFKQMTSTKVEIK